MFDRVPRDPRINQFQRSRIRVEKVVQVIHMEHLPNVLLVEGHGRSVALGVGDCQQREHAGKGNRAKTRFVLRLGGFYDRSAVGGQHAVGHGE